MYEREQQYFQERYPRILTTLEELTGFKRGSKFLPGLNETAAYLKEKMEALGCTVTTHFDETYGPTLVSRIKGTGKMRILFYAHMDTVWMDPDVQEPFRIEDDCAYGAGVSDCSHGLIASIYLLEALNHFDFHDYGELIFVFNPDEELTSPSSGKWLKQYSQEVDLALCMEGPEEEDVYITARAGSAYYEINIKGKMAHAGVNPEEGANALVEMTYKLNEILAKEFPDVYLVLCWIKGGSGDCCVSDNAYAMLRYRITTWDVKPQIDAFLRSVEEKTYVPGTSTSITFWPEGGFGPMPRLPWVDKFTEVIHQVSEDLNYPLKEAYAWGGCDAASTVMNCPTIDGLSPFTLNCHNPNEKMILGSIVPRLSLLTAFIQVVCGDEKFLRQDT